MEKELFKSFSKVIIKALEDAQYKQKLLKDPESVLHEEGIEIPKGLKLYVHENTDQEYHIVIPQQPVSQEQLELIAGGGLTKYEESVKDNPIFKGLHEQWLKEKGGTGS